MTISVLANRSALSIALLAASKASHVGAPSGAGGRSAGRSSNWRRGARSW